MERQHRSSARLADNRESNALQAPHVQHALQATVDAQMYAPSAPPYQTVPIYSYPVQAMGTSVYHGPGYFTPQNFPYNAGVGQTSMAGGGYLPYTFPAISILAPQTLAPQPLAPTQGYQLAQSQMMNRTLQPMEQPQTRLENTAYGPSFVVDACFGGVYEPSSGIQTTGQLDYSGVYPPPQYFHQAGFGNVESSMIGNNPLLAAPRAVFGDSHQAATFHPSYQDTMTYRDYQHHTNPEDFGQQHSTPPDTSSATYEQGRYDIQQLMQPTGSALTPVISSSQHHNIHSPHASAFANTGQVAATPMTTLPQGVSSSPWQIPTEGLYTQQEQNSYRSGSVSVNINDELNKRIYEVAESLSKLNFYNNETVKESDDKYSKYTEPKKATDRRRYGRFHSAGRGRKNTVAHRIETSARSKNVFHFGQEASPKGKRQIAHGTMAAKEMNTKQTAKETNPKEVKGTTRVDAPKEISAKEIKETAKETNTKETTKTDSAKENSPAAKKVSLTETKEDGDEARPAADGSAGKEETA